MILIDADLTEKIKMKNKGIQVNVIFSPGKIYILRNPMFKDALVKIGRTINETETRAKQLSSVTGVPYPYEVLYEEDVVDYELAEKLIHEKLDSYRVNPRREFFQLPLKVAVKAVFETCLSINKPILSEASRLVIFLNTSAAIELRDLIEPFRGGETAVYLIFENSNARSELALGESWMLNCTAELIVQLKQRDWVDDLFVTTGLLEQDEALNV